MATWYVDPDAAGSADGTSWTNAYTALQTAVAAKAANLTGAGPVTFLCRSSAGTADTTAVTVGGYTTTAADYIEIKTDTTDRAGCSWNAAKYRLAPSDAACIIINEDYVRVDGLQIAIAATTAARNGVYVALVGAATDIRLSNLLVKGSNSADYGEIGININDSTATVSIWNCLIYGLASSASRTTTFPFSLSCAAASIYNCVGIGGYRGVRVIGGDVVAKNTYCGLTHSADFDVAGGSLTKVNCASEDSTADDDNAGDELATDCIVGVACDTDTFVNVTAGSEDFHLAADGLSPLQGTGAAPGGSAPLNYTTDIDGETVTTWCIGVDGIAAASFARPSSDVAGGTFRSIVTTAPFGPRVIA